MGAATEKHNTRHQLTRVEQDEFAAQSHQRAGRAADSGLFAQEITPVSVPQRKGDPIVVSADEGIRPDTTADGLATLRPAFAADGTITAGSSSPITDGAAAVVVMSKTKAHELGLSWLAQIGAHGMVAGPDDSSLHEQPANAVLAACAKEGIKATDLDIVEINEAFAAVGVVSTRKLGIDPARVNPNGGAIALGHPLGCSGARIATTLLHELKRRGGRYGLATMCIGMGQGIATIFERL
jgi:acetyl-CoA C-acetyltransferase